MPEKSKGDMVKILNVDNLPDKSADDPKFESKMKTLYLGAAAGSEKLYVNIDYVKPGARSVKYHSHSKQEEFFLQHFLESHIYHATTWIIGATTGVLLHFQLGSF